MAVEHITLAGTSVLDDLGVDPGYVVKAKLATRIQKDVLSLRLSERDAANRMGVSQSKLSLLARGKLNGVSQTKLYDCLSALGHDIEINIRPRRERAAQIATSRDLE